MLLKIEQNIVVVVTRLKQFNNLIVIGSQQSRLTVTRLELVLVTRIVGK